MREKNNYAEAVKWYSLAAEQNDGYALYSLGHMYYQGVNVDKDVDKGLELYVKSADNGCVFAMTELGDYYFYRFNNCVDYAKSAAYYEKALAIALKNDFYNIKSILKSLIDCYILGKNIDGGKARFQEVYQMYREIIQKEKKAKKEEKLKKKQEKKQKKDGGVYIKKV